MSTDTSAASAAVDTFDRQTTEGIGTAADDNGYVYDDDGKLIWWPRNVGPMQSKRIKNLRRAKLEKHLKILEGLGVGITGLVRLHDNAPDLTGLTRLHEDAPDPAALLD
jgi:hypothetical protein